MTDLRNSNLNELQIIVEALGEKKYRAAQMFDWLHKKRVSEINEMTNIPRAFLSKLAENCYITPARVVKKLAADGNNTIKYLLEMQNQVIIECVAMRSDYGVTVCVSTQAGCRMACAFCASGLRGLDRSLTAGEILSQVYVIGNDLDEPVSNVVMMGGGEPLDNYENSVKFIRLINDPNGANISQRRVTLSTCGLVEGIRRLVNEGLQITLAVSLHAPNDEIRREIMPAAVKNPYDKLLAACRDYADKTKRRVTIEYALIKGVNDSDECAFELGRRLKGVLCHVNIIPVNDVAERGFVKSTGPRVKRFAAILKEAGIEVTERLERGSEIAAACGQLRNGYARQEG